MCTHGHEPTERAAAHDGPVQGGKPVIEARALRIARSDRHIECRQFFDALFGECGERRGERRIVIREVPVERSG